MVDISFLYNYKGALYPLNLDDWHGSHAEEKESMSLLDLAANKIVQDASTVRRVIKFLPCELHYNLMRAALIQTRDRSVEILVANWPWKVLTLRKFVPCLFGSVEALHDDDYLSERMRKGVKYTTCLAHTFVECLKKRSPTQLKILDLTGYPAAEVIVNYLASHVLLVHNETRQKEIVNMYNQVTEGLPTEQKQIYNVDTTLPEDTFLITIDAFLQTMDTHMELCRALKISKTDTCKFKLRVNRVDLTCLGVARISVLLEQVDPKYLTGLCMQYNSIMNEGMVILGPSFKDLKSLVSLDLSCNNLNLTDDYVTDLLGEALGEMPVLRRLDLSNNRLKYRLRRVLSTIKEGLRYLRLCACGLHDMDLRYLKLSHHCHSLQEVDLSENNIGRSFEQFIATFLNALHKTVVVLEFADCDFEEPHWVDLVHKCQQLNMLQYLDVSRNESLGAELMNLTLPMLVSIAHLKGVTVSYPIECYDQEHIVDEQKILFQNRIRGHMEDACQRLGRSHIKVKMIS